VSFLFESTHARATDQCAISLVVSEFRHKNKISRTGSTVNAVLKGREKEYQVFAADIEQALIKTAKDSMCSDTNSSPIVIELQIVKVRISEPKANVESLITKLGAMKGAYVSLNIDRGKRSVLAVVYWNPRRMLRDQLILEGWAFERQHPLRPFYYSEVAETAPAFRIPTVTSYTLARRDRRVARLKGAVPDDLICLVARSPFIHSIAPSPLVGSAVRRIIEVSRLGYTAIVRTEIQGAFLNRDPIFSIDQVKNAQIKNLYRGEWGTKSKLCKQ